jgi:predicted negative regulator of RcsB-dependent stress response
LNHRHHALYNSVPWLSSHEHLRRKIDEMEKRYDAKFYAVFATLSKAAGDTNSAQTADRMAHLDASCLAAKSTCKSLNVGHLFIHKAHPAA